MLKELINEELIVIFKNNPQHNDIVYYKDDRIIITIKNYDNRNWDLTMDLDSNRYYELWRKSIFKNKNFEEERDNIRAFFK